MPGGGSEAGFLPVLLSFPLVGFLVSTLSGEQEQRRGGEGERRVRRMGRGGEERREEGGGKKRRSQGAVNAKGHQLRHWKP